MPEIKRLSVIMWAAAALALLSLAALTIHVRHAAWFAAGFSATAAALALLAAFWTVRARNRTEATLDAMRDEADANLQRLAHEARERLCALESAAEHLVARQAALQTAAAEQCKAAARLREGFGWKDGDDATVETARRLGDAVQTEAAAVEEMVASIRSVSDTMGGLADTVNGVSSAISQMAGSIGQVAANAQNANELSRQANTKAVDGGKAVEQLVQSTREIAEDIGTVVGRMQQLGEASTRIGNIVEVIDAIADQTNLLALNAAIEAARAGEHGRGFAVVADEVRKLAENSAASTKEIGLLVRDIQQKTAEVVTSTTASGEKARVGLEMADHAGRAIAEILASVTESSHLISQISLTAREQAAGSKAIVDSVEQMNALIRTVAGSLDEQNSSNHQMNRTVMAMNDLTRMVREAVESQRAALAGVARLASELEAAARQGAVAVEQMGEHTMALHVSLRAPAASGKVMTRLAPAPA